MKKRTEKIILISIAVLLILFKHFLISNLPIEARAYNTDDRLMVDMAFSLLNYRWLGKYRGAILMKGCFFPIFLAVINLLRMNYLTALNLMNTLAAIFFVSQLRGLLKKPVFRLILFGILLYNPCSYARLSFQRVYRSSITEWEVLLLWGAYYGIYIRSLKNPGHFRFRELPALFLTGFVLWAAWNTREECFWMIPFIITATLLIAAGYWKAVKEKTCSWKLAGLRSMLLMLPFILLFMGNLIIVDLNEKYYGDAVRLEIDDGNYSKALKSIYSVKNKQDIMYVTVSAEKLERILTISPALQQIRPELEKELHRYDNADRHHGDSEVEDGWFYWGLKYAAFNNGIADSLPKSQAYWNIVYQEVEAALDDPSSGLERQSVMPSALMSPIQERYLEIIPRALSDTLRFLVSYKEVYPLKGASNRSNPNVDLLFQTLTGNVAFHDEEDIEARAAKELPHLSMAVEWLTLIGDIYRTLNPFACIAGFICFLILIIMAILKKQEELTAACLIICGMFFSMLIISAGVTYTHISAFPALFCNYLSGAYPLMLGSAWFAVLFPVQYLHKRREQ